MAQFVGNQPDEHGIPFYTKDYLELVDWTGRQLRQGKRGFINATAPSILERLGLSAHVWGTLTNEFECLFTHWVGSEQMVKKLYKQHQYQRVPSTNAHKALLG